MYIIYSISILESDGNLPCTRNDFNFSTSSLLLWMRTIALHIRSTNFLSFVSSNSISSPINGENRKNAVPVEEHHARQRSTVGPSASNTLQQCK